MSIRDEPPPDARLRPAVVVWVLRPPIARADVPALCAELTAIIGARAGPTVRCDVAAVTAPDAVTLDALLRLTLTARRAGACLRVTGAGAALRDLLSMTGLATVLSLEQ